MEINRETAMFLWTKCYDKDTRVKDFTGREIEKGSYGDRNSDYGWNLDHILPLSQGGEDDESNLICCHIRTNDEKSRPISCLYCQQKNISNCEGEKPSRN